MVITWRGRNGRPEITLQTLKNYKILTTWQKKKKHLEQNFYDYKRNKKN